IIMKSKFVLGLPVLAVFTLSGLDHSKADTLLNTIGSNLFAPSSGAYVSVDQQFYTNQSQGVQFSTGSDTQVTGGTAYIGLFTFYNGVPVSAPYSTVQLGLMADVGGVPSGTFISGDVIDVALAVSTPINLTGLNWSVSPETTYYLVAVADDHTTGV